MLNIKVGIMPGRLVEVVAGKGTTARELFETANVEISNHEIRLDGAKIDIDTQIQEGNLLVAMKMIKGNSHKIKVGIMPGKLVEVEVFADDTARDLFERAGVEISNHEIRLDGEKIDINRTVNNGSLLVAMKMIKGNSAVVSKKIMHVAKGLNSKEIGMLLGVSDELPTVLHEDDFEVTVGGVFIKTVDKKYDVLVSDEMFESIYELVEEETENDIDILDWEEELFTPGNIPEQKSEAQLKLEFVIDEIEREISSLTSCLEYHIRYTKETELRIEMLEKTLNKLK